MKIVVTHLTRMRAPFICVAGLDLETGRHVRPVLEFGQLGRSLLMRHGGPFDIASIVDLGTTRYAGRPPETEDWRFARDKVIRAGSMAAAEQWRLLATPAHSSLRSIFGDGLSRHGDGCAVDEGKGTVSLGVLRPADRPTLTVSSFDKLRLTFDDGDGKISLPITDLRLYEEDQMTPRHLVMRDIARRIGVGVPVILTVGLGRAWLRSGDDMARHWLQVNNIHLEDNPLWRECSDQGHVVLPSTCHVPRATEVIPRERTDAAWAERLTKMRSEHPKAYMSWTAEDDALLGAGFADGLTTAELITLLERHPGAIRARLKKLGLLQ